MKQEYLFVMKQQATHPFGGSCTYVPISAPSDKEARKIAQQVREEHEKAMPARNWVWFTKLYKELER